MNPSTYLRGIIQVSQTGVGESHRGEGSEGEQRVRLHWDPPLLRPEGELRAGDHRHQDELDERQIPAGIHESEPSLSIRVQH